jgi:predicted unusual protein kinase regulating ubiquinone biosynthesis (AarF/ABC1/UbiB family)
MKLARLTASVGAQALGDKMVGMFASKAERKVANLASQIKQAQKIADALSQMKGAAMKLGQILSIQANHLFPKEVVDILARLQQHSDQVEFETIERVLQEELKDKLGTTLFDVSPEPIAAASIGQVHKAKYKPGNIEVAVKVQYPGVDRSIDSDVDALASLLSVLTRFPNTAGFNDVTEEIKTILKMETDYIEEGETLTKFRKAFSNDDTLVLPEYFPEVSTKRVLVTELVKGISVQQFAESTASAAARNHIGKKYVDVFYRELFQIGSVQTDPNFANYKIQWSFGMDTPKLVLLDFGATKNFTDEFRVNYKLMVEACLRDDYDAIRAFAIKAGFLREDDSKELVDLHYELVNMFMEPFRTNKPYVWHKSDLAERINKFSPKFIFAFKLRPPPKDFIFLHRKIVGVYFFCAAIKAEFEPRPLLERYLT